MYDGNMNFYKHLPNMTTPRTGHSCTYVDYRIIVQGGENETDWLDSVEVLDLASGEGWVLWKPLPRKIAYQAMVNLCGRALSFGGEFSYREDCQAENNEKVMEVSLLNKLEKVFESYQIHKRPRYRDFGYSLAPVYVNDICPPWN